MPRLRDKVPPAAIATRVLKVAMMGESAVDQRAAPIYKKYPNVETTVLAGQGQVEFHLRAQRPPLKTEAQAAVDRLAGELEDEFEDAVFSAQGESLEEIVSYYLQMRNVKLAVAESCTGGIDCRAHHLGRGQFALVSWRRRGVLQRSEDAVRRHSAADDRSPRRGQQRSCAGAGGKHSRDLQCRHRRRRYGHRRPGRRHRRKAGWPGLSSRSPTATSTRCAAAVLRRPRTRSPLGQPAGARHGAPHADVAMRLFVALDIDPEIRQRIAEFRDQMRPYAPDVRWVGPETFHITLQFLGETEKLDEIRRRAEAGRRLAFSMTFRGTGFSPTRSHHECSGLGLSADRAPSAAGRERRRGSEPFGFQTGRGPIQAASDAGARRKRTAAAGSRRAQRGGIAGCGNQAGRAAADCVRDDDGARILSVRKQAVALRREIHQAQSHIP